MKKGSGVEVEEGGGVEVLQVEEEGWGGGVTS